MIKNFETYITEGRMGRLIDASRTEEIRKEDILRLRTWGDLTDFFRNRYKTTTDETFLIDDNGEEFWLEFADPNAFVMVFTDPEGKDYGTMTIKRVKFDKESLPDCNDISDYIYDVCGVDRHKYTVYDGVIIQRADEKPMDLLEVLTEIYDKLISDKGNTNITVIRND